MDVPDNQGNGIIFEIRELCAKSHWSSFHGSQVTDRGQERSIVDSVFYNFYFEGMCIGSAVGIGCCDGNVTVSGKIVLGVQAKCGIGEIMKYFGVLNCNRLHRSIGGLRFDMHDMVHHVVTVNKLAEDCVVKIKVPRWCRSVVERNHIEIEHWVGNKKLRVVCVVT